MAAAEHLQIVAGEAVAAVDLHTCKCHPHHAVLGIRIALGIALDTFEQAM